jgi:CBS domain-containing protein
MKLEELFNQKEFKYRELVTVQPKESISSTIRKLVEHDRGALPVCNDKGELVGIITERDIVRKCFTGGTDCSRFKVQDVMSRKVVIGGLEDDLDYAISAMKHERIRHLPIVDNRKVIGMISMRDLLGVKLEESRAEVKYLTDYISGGFT